MSRDSCRFSLLMVRRAINRIGGLLAFLLGLAVIGAAVRGYGEVVRVGIYENSPKVGTGADGRPEGIFVDIIEVVAEQEGWTLEYLRGTWREGLARVAAGEIDLMPDVAESKSRGNRFAYHSEPVLSDWFQVYARKGSAIRSVMDLADKRIAVLEGSIQEEAFNQMLAGFALPMTILPFPDYRSALDDVSQGKTDAVILNRFHGMQYSRERGLEDTAIIFNPTRLFFAASNSGRERLLDAIDKRLIQMKRNPDSVYYRSLKRWTSEPTAFRLPHWLRIAGAAAVGLLIVSVAWSITLRRQVAHSNAELAARNRLLRVLYECGQAMARCADEQDLLEKLCAILTAGGGCKAAWVSVADNDAGGAVRAVAQSGCGETFLASLTTDKGEPAAGGSSKFDDDACLCLPLVSSGPVLGTLTVARAAHGPCPPADLDFLKEFAGNMAFGIEHLRLEATKQRAEVEKRRSEHSFRQLIEQAPEAIFIQTQGRIAFLNPAACALLGAASPEPLLGRPVSNVIHPDFRDEVMQRIARMQARREPASLSEEVFVRVDGTPVTVEVIATPFAYENESGSLIFARDITERNLQAHRYESLVEDMPSVICRYTPEGALTFVNKAICAFLRLDREAVIGQNNIYAFLQEEDHAVVKNALAPLSPEQPIAEYTLTIRRADR